jgi:hypothetical protein
MERTMTRAPAAPLRRAALLAALLACTGAAADETVTEARLQGAWSIDAGICAQVFTFKNGKPAFLKEDGIIDSGFIVDGKSVRGLMETCRVVASRASSQSGRTLTLSCATSVSDLSRHATTRLTDDNTLVVVDPAMPDIPITYYRCTPP